MLDVLRGGGDTVGGGTAGADAPGLCSRLTRSERLRDAAGYFGAGALPLVVVITAIGLWGANPTVPITAHGDALLTRLFVQNIHETGWYLDSPRLGAPGEHNLRDYPIADVFHLAHIKLLVGICRHVILAENVFKLSLYPLASLSAYFVFRRLRLGRLAALVPSVLFACSSYHFVRLLGGHDFLAAYYLVPAMTWLILLVSMGWNPFARVVCGDRRGLVSWAGRLLGTILVCFLTGMAGVYYAFFSCFLLVATGANAAFRDRRWGAIVPSAYMIAAITAGLAMALAPSFLYWAREGLNPKVARRSPAEADLYGLKVSEMLLPTLGHHSQRLSQFREAYLRNRINTGEWWTASLGVVASLGFLYLMLRRLNWIRAADTDWATGPLAYLAVATLVLCLVGGLGSCFNFVVSPMIRCYVRATVFLHFFSLCGLFLAAHHRFGQPHRSAPARAAYRIALLAVLAFGLWDQIPRGSIFNYPDVKGILASDRDFGTRLESLLPAGAMVYQMPEVSFPEHPPVHGMPDYELLRPYFHTRTLRFSYGAVRGRATAAWQDYVKELPLAERLDTLAFAGFEGIYLARAGFADRGARREAELTTLLGVTPMVSPNGRQSFFDLRPFSRGLRSRYGSEWASRREAALHPVYLHWGAKFTDLVEDFNGETYRSSIQESSLTIHNTGDTPRAVTVTFEYSAYPGMMSIGTLRLGGSLCRQDLPISDKRRPATLRLLVPPGKHSLTLFCDAPPETPPPHDRLHFRIWNFRHSAADTPPTARGAAAKP